MSALTQQTNKKIRDGETSPLGATLTSHGVNFAVYSQYASTIYLLLFDECGASPTDIIALIPSEQNIWNIFVHGIKTGQLYGLKAVGDYNPTQGMRFNEHKLLIDPYARAIIGPCCPQKKLFLGYNPDSPNKDLEQNHEDSTLCAPKSIVVDNAFDWEDDTPLIIPMEDLVIYETHLKGFTAHPSSKARHPGTYLGFIEKIPYLKSLGINAVELLPVHQHYTRGSLLEKGLTDYWGYNTIGYFAPEMSYSSQSNRDSPVREFKTLVKALHKAGIEVILDVVYNHTGEGNELGPTLCFRGIDNSTYYSLRGTKKEPYRYYLDAAGCGNILNIENPVVLNLVLDSLRYWTAEMHVDGFRFDLASILARVKGRYNKESAFFTAVDKDPVLSKVKLIAEPWDMTTYQVGNFPLNWSEWNGKYRDTVRKFNKGERGQVQDLAWRLTGSADLYGDDGRSPYHSVNFVTCHDGFTLHDLYAYSIKHNELNQENNRDGMNENKSWNCGAEGNTDDGNIIDLRLKLMKNALCLLFFSLGTPMLCGGDEFLRTQRGNNNAYCQDNDISWIDWTLIEKNKNMVEFCRKLIVYRNTYTILKHRHFLSGQDQDADAVPDILWFDEHHQTPDWHNPDSRTLCYQLDGSESPSPQGNYHLYFILNSDEKDKVIRIPSYPDMHWYRAIDTSLPFGDDFYSLGLEQLLNPSDHYPSQARSIVALVGRMGENNEK